LSTQSGTSSVSGRFEMTMPAACLDAWRSSPSRRSARSISRPLPLLAVAERGQARLHLERLLEREVLPLLRLGIELRDAVGLGEREVEDAADVLDGRLPLQRPERDDLRDAVGAVLLAHVADHLVAPDEAEVDVDVGHRLALGVEEALEEEPVLDRVEVRDAERPRDHAARRGAAARADRDAALLRPVDEVGDDEEVAREAHRDDGGELDREPVLVLLLPLRAPVERAARVQALVEPLADLALERRLERLAGRCLIDRELELLLQLEVAPPAMSTVLATASGMCAKASSISLGLFT
jgi:hypothetical protein